MDSALLFDGSIQGLRCKIRLNNMTSMKESDKYMSKYWYTAYIYVPEVFVRAHIEHLKATTSCFDDCYYHNWDDVIDVHGGITYCDTCGHKEDFNGHILGWDYHHIDDDIIKHTYDSVKDNLREAVEQLKHTYNL